MTNAIILKHLRNTKHEKQNTIGIFQLGTNFGFIFIDKYYT